MLLETMFWAVLFPGRVMSSHLPALCMRHPSLVVELSKELVEFSGTVTNIESKEDIFTHVVRCSDVGSSTCSLSYAHGKPV